MRRLVAITVAAHFWTGYGLGCDEYCDKMDRCSGNRTCDRGRCRNLCEKTLEAGRKSGWEDQAQCALDVSCADLEDGACLEDASLGLQWCEVR